MLKLVVRDKIDIKMSSAAHSKSTFHLMQKHPKPFFRFNFVYQNVFSLKYQAMINQRNCLILLMCLVLVHAEESTLQLDVHKMDSLVANFTQTYSIKINETHKESQWNLFFVLDPVDEQFQLPTTMVIYKKKADGTNDFEVNCSTEGIDECSLNALFIQNNDTIYLNVSCNDTCKYDLMAYWSNSTTLTLEQPLTLNFQDSAYAKLFLVDFSKVEFTQAQVILQAETFLEASSPILLVANFGKKKPPTIKEHDIGSVHLWNDGLGIFIDKASMKENILTVLVVGPAQNILKISAHARKNDSNQLFMFQPKFDELVASSQRGYFINLKNVSHLADNDLLVKISIFTGDLQAQFFSDKEYKNELYVNTFHHMGDSLFRFSKDHRLEDNLTDFLYLKIRSSDAHSTYVLNFYCKIEKLIRLQGQLAELSELKSHQVDNYYVNVVKQAKSTDKITAKFLVQSYSGTQEVRFSICKGEFDTCATDWTSYEANKTTYEKLHPSHTSKTGQTTIYKLDLDFADFANTSTDNYKSLILAIYVANPYPEKSKYSITFVDHTKTVVLRENHPIKERLTEGQTKYYRVTALGDGIKSVRVHLVEISGKTTMLGFHSDPRNDEEGKTTPPAKTAQHNILLFTENLHLPIFVVLYGEDNSFFSLTLSLVRQPAISISDRTIKDHFNIFVVPQHVQQQITLNNLQSEVVELLPHQQDYQITVYSSLPLDYCGSYNLDKYPIDPNCDFKIIHNKSLQITNAKKVLVAIHNPNNKTVRSTIKYTNKYSCEQKAAGQVWSKKIDQKGSKCVKYHLPRKDSFELMVGMSNQQYSTANITAILGDELMEVTSSYTLFKKEDVEKGCKPTQSCDITFVVSQQANTIIHVVAQYIDKEITLLDGLAQNVYGAYGLQVYSEFKYHLQDKVNTSIMLESKRGYYEFFVNIVNDTEYKTGWTDLFPTRTNFQYKSVQTYYSLFNHLLLKQDELKNHSCTKCLALISVCLKGQLTERDGHFILQVSQELHHLVEHKQTVGYIQENSFAYYTYYSPKKGSLFITLTTENKRCANIYLRQGTDMRASGTNYTAKSFGNDMFFNCVQGMYSITLEAYSNCHYTISASSSDYRIYELTPGIHKDVKLQANEYAYFFYFHILNTSFKIMSLQEYGEVVISANQTSKFVMEQFDKLSTIDLSKFSWHDQKDVLAVSTTHEGFCFNCYYMIIVKPLQKTQTSLIVANTAVEVPLTVKKHITDTLNPKEEINYKLFDSRKELNISLDVYFGEIQVTVKSGGKNNKKTFTNQNYTQNWTFIHYGEQDDFNRSPIVLNVKANALALYRLAVSSDQPGRQTLLKKGLPTHMFLSKDALSCVSGTIESKQHKVIASTHIMSKQKLKNINISARLAGKIVTNFKKSTIENTISLQFDLAGYAVSQSANFTYCFETNQTVALSIVLVGSVNFLPEATSQIVDGAQSFLMVPQGKFVIEVFQCEGTATLLLSNSFSDSHNDTSDIIHWKRFGQNFLIEAQYSQLAYLHLEGKKTLLKWSHENERTYEGIGYHTYQIPHHKYKFANKKVVIQVPPIYRSEAAKSNLTIKTVKYTIMLSDDEAALKRGVQCNIGPIFNESKTVDGKLDDLTATIDFIFPFADLNKTFANSSYIWSSVVAELVLINGRNNTENYRFVYDDDEIPWKQSVRVEVQTVTVKEKNNWTIPIIILSTCLGILMLIAGIRCIIVKFRRRITFDLPEEIDVKDTDRN